MSNVWFGNSSRVGALLVASIDLANALVHAATALVVIFLPQLFVTSTPESSFLFPVNYKPDAYSYKESVVTALVATAAVFAAESALAALLFCAILKRDPFKCDMWVKIRLVLMGVGTFGYVFEMTLVSFTNSWQVFTVTLILFLAVVYRSYTILIVRSLRTDILFVLNGYDLGLMLFASPTKHYGNAL